MFKFSTANAIRTKKKYSWNILRLTTCTTEFEQPFTPKKSYVKPFWHKKTFTEYMGLFHVFFDRMLLGSDPGGPLCSQHTSANSQLSTKRHVMVRRLRSVYYRVAKLQWSKLKQFEPSKNPWNIFPKTGQANGPVVGIVFNELWRDTRQNCLLKSESEQHQWWRPTSPSK